MTYGLYRLITKFQLMISISTIGSNSNIDTIDILIYYRHSNRTYKPC